MNQIEHDNGLPCASYSVGSSYTTKLLKHTPSLPSPGCFGHRSAVVVHVAPGASSLRSKGQRRSKARCLPAMRRWTWRAKSGPHPRRGRRLVGASESKDFWRLQQVHDDLVTDPGVIMVSRSGHLFGAVAMPSSHP